MPLRSMQPEIVIGGITWKYGVSYISWTQQAGCGCQSLISIQVGCDVLPECIFPDSCPEDLLYNERAQRGIRSFILGQTAAKFRGDSPDEID